MEGVWGRGRGRREEEEEWGRKEGGDEGKTNEGRKKTKEWNASDDEDKLRYEA